MSCVIAKFGGTSVATLDLMRHAAGIVQDLRKKHGQVVVVVSAMGDQTDDLIRQIYQATPSPTKRELDVIAHTGELVSSSLFASVLQKLGCPSRSLSGSLAGINTNSAHGNAKILDIDTGFLRKILDQGEIPVVAGFQGANSLGEVTTFGRGGSDTTAAALGVALGVKECLIYTDVSGVYTADPRICPDAQLLSKINFEEILELAALGAKVLHPRAVELAGRGRLPMRVLSTFEPDMPGTQILFDEEMEMEQPTVTGITYSLEEAKITLRGVPDEPGIAARVFTTVADNNINVDVIVQNVGADGKATDISFTVPQEQVDRAIGCLGKVKEDNELNYEGLESNGKIAKVSLVGIGMRSHAGVASEMFKCLAEIGANIQMIATSEIKISVIIDVDKAKEAVAALHKYFKLDTKQELGVAAKAG